MVAPCACFPELRLPARGPGKLPGRGSIRHGVSRGPSPAPAPGRPGTPGARYLQDLRLTAH